MGKREELEAKLIETPNDGDLRMVYADLLQSTGDPRGELIVLSQRGANIDDYIAKHEEALLGPLVRFKKTFDHDSQDAFTWHHGFIKSAKIGYETHSAGDIDEDADECTADKVVAALLQHPSALLLEELTVTMNMLDDGMYFSDVVKAIAQYGAPALRTLRLGEFQQAGPGGVDNGYDYENSWAGLGDASELWKAVPRLEHLRIQLNLGGASANGADTIGTFDLPRLRTLEIVTGGLSAHCARSFASGKLPAAESIELWFGSNNYGGDATTKDLETLLAGDNVPKLSYLGLKNAEFTDDIVAALAPSKVLSRIKALSLAHGMMTDAGAQLVATHADAFKHLTQLDLSNNYITSAGLDAVRGVCPITSEEQREGDDYRYPALAE
ncbi:MAG: TIGR02996 domain-containing protein [Myxococcota bacterium]|nr:TIGR02996 domain-containing protein [Myxococcota bacterium]